MARFRQRVQATARARAERSAEENGAAQSGSDAAAASPRAAIEEQVAALARAFESRNLRNVRRIYPSMSVQQAQEWGGLFMRARNLRVNLRVAALEPERGGAEMVATVEGSYDYEDLSTGQGVARPVSFRGRYAGGGGGPSDWVLMSLTSWGAGP